MSVLFSQKVNFLTKLCKLQTSPTPVVSSIDTNNSRLCSVSWHPLIQDQEGGGCIHFSLSFLSFMCLLSELKFVKNTAPGTTRNFLWNFSMIPVSSPNVSTQYCLKLTGNGSLVSKSQTRLMLFSCRTTRMTWQSHITKPSSSLPALCCQWRNYIHVKNKIRKGCHFKKSNCKEKVHSSLSVIISLWHTIKEHIGLSLI